MHHVFGLNDDSYHSETNQPVGIEKLNPVMNLENSCSHYLDCMNCTVARCQWSQYGYCEYPK